MRDLRLDSSLIGRPERCGALYDLKPAYWRACKYGTDDHPTYRCQCVTGEYERVVKNGGGHDCWST